MNEDIETPLDIENAQEKGAEENEHENEEEVVTLSVTHASFAYALAEVLVEASAEVPESWLGKAGAFRVVDEQGEETARAEVSFDEPRIEAAAKMAAPETPGRHAYQATLELEGDGGDGCAVPFELEVREHRVVLSAWGTPTPVNSSDTFTVHIGARCPGNCRLAGSTIAVNDESGERVASALLEGQVKEGTAGTYCVAIELVAPDDEALHVWTVLCMPPEMEAAHKAEAIDLVFRTSAAPEHTATVRVVTARDRVPAEAANVMVGLRRTFTDAEGVARVKVSSGPQMLRASKQDYRSVEEEIVVDGDAEFTVELVYDPTL